MDKCINCQADFEDAGSICHNCYMVLEERIKQLSHWNKLWKDAAKHYRKSWGFLVNKSAATFGKAAGKFMPKIIDGWIRESEKDKRIRQLEGALQALLDEEDIVDENGHCPFCAELEHEGDCPFRLAAYALKEYSHGVD